jgi:hypothetical protein
MTMYSGPTPTIGTPVVSSDGVDLGRVKEVSGSCFKVDAPMAPDYWLASDCITDNNGVVRLSVTKDGLDDVKVDRDEHTGSHLHS